MNFGVLKFTEFMLTKNYETVMWPVEHKYPLVISLQPTGFGYKVSGAGGNRTRVQTSNLCAFYMLILLLIFDYSPRTNTLTTA